MAEGGELATLSKTTIDQLNTVLPPTWSHGNPVDIIGDANGQRYADALKVLLNDRDCDGILILNCPTAVASSDEAAAAVIGTLPETILQDRFDELDWRTVGHRTQAAISRTRHRNLSITGGCCARVLPDGELPAQPVTSHGDATVDAVVV